MTELIGKTIKNIIEGEQDNWDMAAIIETTDGEIYYLTSGSSNSHGMYCIEKVYEIPNSFKPDK